MGQLASACPGCGSRVEAGLPALLSDFVVWWVLMRDDCNPNIVGIVFNIGLCVVLIPAAVGGSLPAI